MACAVTGKNQVVSQTGEETRCTTVAKANIYRLVHSLAEGNLGGSMALESESGCCVGRSPRDPVIPSQVRYDWTLLTYMTVSPSLPEKARLDP